MTHIRTQNKRCADPVMHLLLSWRENENPTKEQVIEAVKITLGELNLSQCQTVYALHQNTDNMHLHICVNRIDPETTKAIQAAGGWTRRAMEGAARLIERAQGWQTESNTWSEIDEQGELVRKPYSPENAVPQKVRDMENLTGEQSSIRKAQNILKDKLKGLSDWEGFYSLLSQNGVKYQKKGSGAVITVDDVTVKASDVSRNLTLAKLTRQLGPYREAPQLAQSVYSDKSKEQKVPQPLDDANRGSEHWNAYMQAKAEHFGNNKERRERLYMTQRKESDGLRDRQKLERQALAKSYGSGITRREINRQRSILATKHAYGRAVLKEKHKGERETFRIQSASFMSYEGWLRSQNLTEEAEKWRHRKNKRILLLEMPDGTAEKARQGNIELSGFSMTVTRQGVKFASQDNPKAVAFIDVGRVIKVYKQDADTLLAALRLAQEKWGGVRINGTDEYKRKCAQIAARNGIRVSNPELSDIVKEFERKTQPPMSIEVARKTIDAEIKSQEYKHWRAWHSYNGHKKELETLTTVEPKKPKFLGFGVKKWRADHGVWEAERDRLFELIRSDLESLGVKLAHDGSDMDKAHREATVRNEHYKNYAAEEARRLHPEADAIILYYDARIEREERARRDAEEAKVRAQKELNRRFYAAVRKLAAKFGHDAPIITDAQDRRTYNGRVIGTAERDGSHYAVQVISKNRVILHHVEKDGLSHITAIVGKKVEIKCVDWRIGAIMEESERHERSRGWSR
jgi:hypothetical protein